MHGKARKGYKEERNMRIAARRRTKGRANRGKKSKNRGGRERERERERDRKSEIAREKGGGEEDEAKPFGISATIDDGPRGSLLCC